MSDRNDLPGQQPPSEEDLIKILEDPKTTGAEKRLATFQFVNRGRNQGALPPGETSPVDWDNIYDENGEPFNKAGQSVLDEKIKKIVSGALNEAEAIGALSRLSLSDGESPEESGGERMLAEKMVAEILMDVKITDQLFKDFSVLAKEFLSEDSANLENLSRMLGDLKKEINGIDLIFKNLLKSIKNLGAVKTILGKEFSRLSTHDIINPMSAVQSNMEFTASYKDIRDKRTVNNIKDAVKDIFSNWHTLACAITDDLTYVLLKNSDEIVSTDAAKVIRDFKLPNGTADAIAVAGERASNFSVNYNPKKTGPNAAPKVTFNNYVSDFNNLEIDGNAAVYGNLVANLINNACSRDTYKSTDNGREISVAGIHASEVNITVEYDQSDLVVTVVDNGDGISQEALNPSNEKFIFSGGVSGRGSTGLGLKDANYLSENGVRVIVASRKKDLGAATVGVCYTNSDKEAPRTADLQNALKSADISTIFQIRATLKPKTGVEASEHKNLKKDIPVQV